MDRFNMELSLMVFIFLGVLFGILIHADWVDNKVRKELNELIEPKYDVVVDGWTLCGEENGISVYLIRAREKIKIQNTFFLSNKATVLCLAVVNKTKIIELKDEICLKLCPEWWQK